MAMLPNIVLIDAACNTKESTWEELLTVFVNPVLRKQPLPVLLRATKERVPDYQFLFTKRIGFTRNTVEVSADLRRIVQLKYEHGEFFGKEIFNVAILRES